MSRFAIKLVAKQFERIWHFVRGRRPRIRRHVLSVNLTTFEENMKKAFWSKDIEREISVDDTTDRGG